MPGCNEREEAFSEALRNVARVAPKMRRRHLNRGGILSAMSDLSTLPPLRRNQAEARRVAMAAYAFRCCVVCGLQVPTSLTVAHLDQSPDNNDPENLAFLCHTHHWMYDAGLYPIEAIKLLRAHWQQTMGKPSHKARMKDAGVKAATTRKRKAAARKAWITRREVVSPEGGGS